MNIKKRFQHLLSIFFTCIMVCCLPLKVLASDELLTSDIFSEEIVIDVAGEESVLTAQTELPEQEIILSEAFVYESELVTDDESVGEAVGISVENPDIFDDGTETAGEKFSCDPIPISETERKKYNQELSFDIAEEEIKGYVTVCFEDYGVRLSKELSSMEEEHKNPIGVIVEGTRVPFKAYDTIASVTLRLLKALGMTESHTGDEYSGFYLSAIGNFTVNGKKYTTLGEFDAGAGSGWMITYNNWFINKGASEFAVEDGDLIRWQYTCQQGADIGCDKDKPSAEITGIQFKEEYGVLSKAFDKDIESYVYAVPEDINTISLQAKQENYWAVTVYTSEGKTYKPMAEIPVSEGTEIILKCSYADRAGQAAADTDRVVIVIHKEHTVTANVQKDVSGHWNSCSNEECKLPFNKEEHHCESWTLVSKATVFKPQVEKGICTECSYTVKRNVGKKSTAVLEVPGKLKSFNIKVGNTRKFKITMANGDSIKSVKSNKSGIVKSSFSKKNGTVTLKGIKAGTAKITITLKSGKKRTYTVKAVKGTVVTTKLTVNNVTDKKLTLKKGKTFTIKTTRVPFTSTQKVTYKNSNNKVVKVNSAGKLTAVKKGTAYVTVKSGNKSVKIKVTVK